MKRLLFTLLALTFGSAFATSATEQAAAKAAMTECLKTKTQQECTDAQTAAQKAAAAKKSATTTAS